MEHRTLELNLGSAKDLKNVNLFSKMDVYAVVSLSGVQKIKTPVDRNGGSNPTWNVTEKFTIDESLARQNRLTLEIKLRCERNLSADKEIGQVLVPVKELLAQPGDGKSFQHVSYQIRKPSGKPRGAFTFSYRFSDKFTAPGIASAPVLSGAPKTEPVTAYPAPAVGSTSASYPGVYPPPPQPQYAGGYGYPSAPQAAYGYAPQAAYGYAAQPGYGYPPAPAPAQRPRKNKFGMGLGAGLLGGALGGLLIGDMISDVGSYDAGCDAGFGDGGFGDGGGFDF